MEKKLRMAALDKIHSGTRQMRSVLFMVLSFLFAHGGFERGCRLCRLMRYIYRRCRNTLHDRRFRGLNDTLREQPQPYDGDAQRNEYEFLPQGKIAHGVIGLV